MEDRVAELRSRWTPETTAAAVALLESRPTNYDLTTIEEGGATYLDLRGLRIEQTQIDKAVLRNVNLRWAVFRDVGLKGARFINCNLSQVAFVECYLRHTQFEKCDLLNARFDSCDFSQAVISDSRVDFASFRQCEIRRETIKFEGHASPRAMVRVCRSLKLNAMSMGNFADAGDLTYLEKTYERRGFFRDGAWGTWFGSALQNLFWGYGEKPWRIALFMVFNIIVFGTLLHWMDPLPGKTWWDHIYFSGITYLTIGYGDMAPHGPISRLLAVIEGATGIATFGMLIASVTKMIMNR